MNKPKQQQGLFITIEGTEGSGKTSICKKLEEYFNAHNIESVFTREPGGSYVDSCQKIRELLLTHNDLDAHTEVLLFAANRCEHINKLIKPALNEGKIVVCDRFVDSSLAYQGMGREVGIKKVKEINDFAIQELEPDLTIFIDLAPEIGLERIKKFRSNEINHLDQAPLMFHQKVYEGYKLINKSNKKRIKTVEGNQKIEDIFKDIIKIINDKLKEGKYRYYEI